MKIRIESTELKSLLEKVFPAIPKKSKLPSLECVLLESSNGNLSATATDLDAFLTVNTGKYKPISNGSILIHKDDIKLINKLSGDLEIILLNNEVIIKTDKKAITVINHDIENYPKFKLESEKLELFNIDESQFTNAINKLINFTSQQEHNLMMQYYNINTDRNRIESLDGNRIGIVNINLHATENTKSIKIHSRINTDLKKVLNNKSKESLQFTEQQKFNIITGTDFTYMQRASEGEYFKVDNFVTYDYEFLLKVKNKTLQEIAKFNLDLLKESKKPMILNYDNTTNKHHIYANNGKNKTVDKLDLLESKMMNNDFTIAFNPQFICDALKCLNEEEVIITGNTRKNPITIKGENELYIVLPVNLTEEQILVARENIREVA